MFDNEASSLKKSYIETSMKNENYKFQNKNIQSNLRGDFKGALWNQEQWGTQVPLAPPLPPSLRTSIWKLALWIVSEFS